MVLIAGLWVVGLLLMHRAGNGLPWHENGSLPNSSPRPNNPHRRTDKKPSTAHAAVVCAISAAATLAAGVVLEQAGDAASTKVGLPGILFVATVLALATSLPEISTGLQWIKQGDDNLAMSDIFEGNGFLPVLFLVATVITGKATLPSAHSSDIYLAALGALLALVYAVGLVFRPTAQRTGMGTDSLAVIRLYILGIGEVPAIAR